jgi:hypothetical protein
MVISRSEIQRLRRARVIVAVPRCVIVEPLEELALFVARLAAAVKLFAGVLGGFPSGFEDRDLRAVAKRHFSVSVFVATLLRAVVLSVGGERRTIARRVVVVAVLLRRRRRIVSLLIVGLLLTLLGRRLLLARRRRLALLLLLLPRRRVVGRRRRIPPRGPELLEKLPNLPVTPHANLLERLEMRWHFAADEFEA